MTTDFEGEAKLITIEWNRPGYAHTRIGGRYNRQVSERDIASRLAHPYFGGRMEQFGNGHFVYVRHDD